MKKRNIVLGFVASLILLTAYMFSSYRIYTQEYLKYMDVGYKLNYIAIIPIILLIIHFSIVIIKKKNTILTKVLLITVVIMNILIGSVQVRVTNWSNIISVIFNVLLLAYLIKVWFVSRIPLNNKAIIVAFEIVVAISVIGNIYAVISVRNYIEYMFDSFIITMFPSVLSQVAYTLLAFYYNDLYFENDDKKQNEREVINEI